MTRSWDQVPLGRIVSSEPGNEGFGFGIELGTGPCCPGLHFLKQGHFLSSWRLKQQGGRIDGFRGCIFGFVVEGIVFVYPINLALEDTSCWLRCRRATLCMAEGIFVLLEGMQKGGRAGKEPFLEGHQHEVRGKFFRVVHRSTLPELGVFPQRGVNTLFVLQDRRLPGLRGRVEESEAGPNHRAAVPISTAAP